LHGTNIKQIIRIFNGNSIRRHSTFSHVLSNRHKKYVPTNGEHEDMQRNMDESPDVVRTLVRPNVDRKIIFNVYQRFSEGGFYVMCLAWYIFQECNFVKLISEGHLDQLFN
jgi:hypothetical protein